MDRIEKCTAVRREIVKNTNKAIDKLNDRSQTNAALLRLFNNWKKDDLRQESISGKGVKTNE